MEMTIGSQPMYTAGEERFNVISHAAGVFLSIEGCIVMVALARGWAAVASSIVYGLSMVLMYSMSTLYHAVSSPRAKGVLRIMDHASIYLLIGGCYTPIILVLLRSSNRALPIFAIVWILAVAGIVLNIANLNRFKKVGLVLYILMGWAVLLDIRNVVARMDTGGTVLLFAGGLCYMIGVVFYKLKRIPYMHGVWHLFVLAGSILHYFCILFYIILP